MRPIILNASLDNYGYFAGRKRTKSFRQVAKKIWTRDNFTCQYCGFQAREYQEIVNADQNYRRNTASNLTTSCCFCTQCFFLESCGEGGYGGGTMIYLPEISQNDLNSLCHVLFCAMVNETSYKDSAQAIYRTLRVRSQTIEDQLGEGASNPIAFGQLIVEYKQNKKKDLNHFLTNFRLLPSRARFKKQIEHWARQALSEME